MFVFYLIVLRFIHVIASVCWAGGAFIFFLFVEPTAKALAPQGQQFVQHMVNRRRYSIFMALSSTLTVLSGALLMWQIAGSNWLAYARTGPGLGFALGAAAGIVVYLIGMLGVKPRAEKIVRIGARIRNAGGVPTPEQTTELRKLDREMSTLGVYDFVLVALSLALMGTARYWLF